MTQEFSLTFWGVRGSYPSTGPEFVATGGNTPCVEMRVDGQQLIFDAGTGLIALGDALVAAKRRRPLLLLLSHFHHDHVQGLPHFAPLYEDAFVTYIVAPWNAHQHRVWEMLVNASSLANRAERPGLQERRRIHVIEGGERIWWNADAETPLLMAPDHETAPPEGYIEIYSYHSAAHPRGGSMCYRISNGLASAVLATDVEAYVGADQGLVRFAEGADLIIHDAHYTPEEYSNPAFSKQGWGHSTWAMAVEVARLARIRQVALFHHDPAHDDALMEEIEAAACAEFPGAFVAREGLTIDLHPIPVPDDDEEWASRVA